MNRNDFQHLARCRRREALALLRAGNYDGAYYLAGYAIEFAVKACIAKKTNRHDFPDKVFVAECHTHDLRKLLKLAGLESQLDLDSKADGQLGVNWSVVKDWNENSRYERRSKREARDLYYAVVGDKHGVLSWLRKHW